MNLCNERIIYVNLHKDGFVSTSYFWGRAQEVVNYSRKFYYHVDTWPVLVFVKKCVTVITEAILVGGRGGLEALNQMSPLFITFKKKSFSSTSTPPTLNPTHFLDIGNQNHESLKSVESCFTSSSCTCTFVSVFPVHFQMSCPW